MGRFFQELQHILPTHFFTPYRADLQKMKIDPYTFLVSLARFLGSWLFVVISRVIAAGYFLFSRNMPESHRFYAILFPNRSKLFHLWCTFRQYQNFTTIHFDRFLSSQGQAATCISPTEDQLGTTIGKSGAILLMSHLGNWEMAARLLMQQRHDLQLLLYMGIKEKEGVEKHQKEELRREGVTVIGADQNSSSPFAAIEGIHVLRAGGLVSMTGDIVWRSDQRSVPVTFLGHVAYVPEAPFIFAMVSGAPIFAFFAFRTRSNNYQFTLSKPIFIKPSNKMERNREIAEAAQHYAFLLEQALKSHPLEWYHFDRFIHDPCTSPDSSN